MHKCVYFKENLWNYLWLPQLAQFRDATKSLAANVLQLFGLVADLRMRFDSSEPPR